jgi:flavin-dependent dehydrogenase
MSDDFDVVVVGSGPAGCTAAITLGRNGLRVALLEAHKDANHYKRLCTHSIRSSALPTIRRLGLDTAFDDLGGVHQHEKAWTRFGWVHERVKETEHGYNIRRVTLDPFMRARAAATPGVELMLGARVRELTRSGGRINGVVADVGATQQRIGATLVVGADGYSSKVAELAALKGTASSNSRFAYQATYRNVQVPDGWSGGVWYREPDVNFFFNNDAGSTILAVFPNKDRLAQFSADREGALLASFVGLPNGPDLSVAERVSPVIGTTDYPSITRRRIVAPGVALIGDAAMVGDPVWGTGCGWAFQSAEWLADAVSDALHSKTFQNVDKSARRYQRKHRRMLLPHQLLNIDFARRSTFNPLERLAYGGASRDQRVADRVFAVGTRNSSPLTLLDPVLLTRAAIARRKSVTPQRSSTPATGRA